MTEAEIKQREVEANKRGSLTQEDRDLIEELSVRAKAKWRLNWAK